MTTVLVVLSVFVVLIAVLVGMSVRVLREYERAVVFRLGRLITLKGPGLVILCRRSIVWNGSVCEPSR